MLLLLACTPDVLDSAVPAVKPDFPSIGLELHETYGSLVVASWDQEVEATGHLEYRFDEDWRSTPSRAFEPGDASQIVAGVPFSTELEVRLVLDQGFGEEVGETLSIETGAVPASLPVPELTLAELEAMDPDSEYLLGCMNQSPGGWVGGAFWTFVMDRQGRMVWAHPTEGDDWTIYCSVSRDGESLLLDEATYWADWDGGQGSRIRRMKLDGTVVEVVATPGLHHPFTELPDGSLVYGRAINEYENLKKINPDGTDSILWSCEDWFTELEVNADCQSNSLWWDEASDSFLFSFFLTSEVVQIDHQTGEVLAAWGWLPGSYAFEPVTAKFSWQHAPHFTSEGHLLLSTETPAEETEVREYRIDAETQTLELVWSFGEGEGIHAETAGEAWRLGNGNTLHNYGSATRLREITPEGEVVWEVYWPGRSRLLGRTTFIEDLYALL